MTIEPHSVTMTIDSRQLGDVVVKWALDQAARANSALEGSMEDHEKPSDGKKRWTADEVRELMGFKPDDDTWGVGIEQIALGLTSDGATVEEARERVADLRRQNEADPAVEYRRQRAVDLEGALEHRRFSTEKVEIREVSDGMLRFTGYASITERAYEVGDFEETIARGAFKRTLSESPDVVLLLNHDGLPLARTKSGTLTLTEDARGLRVDADLNPNDPDVQRVRPKLERGDVDEMSFAFRATGQEWNDDYTKRRITGATIHKGDVSIVTYGANDASTGGLVGFRAFEEAEMELRAGKVVSAKHRKDLEAMRDSIDAMLAADNKPEEPGPTQISVEMLADASAAVVAMERAADALEASPSKAIPLVDHTKRARERLAQLRRAR